MSNNYNIIQGGTTFNLDVTDILSNTNSQVRLICKTSGGAITINLPTIESFGANINASIFIDDTDDFAGTNNVTINSPMGNTIENASFYTINTNGGKIQIFISSTTEFGVLGVSSGGGTPIPNNPYDFYLDASAPNGGDGSIEKPFNTLTDLNDAVKLLGTPEIAYVGSVYPSQIGYGGEVVGFLEISPNLSLIGLTPQNTGISCDIKLTAPSIGIVNQYRNLAFNGIFTLDLTLSTFASIVFQNGVVNINRIDSNPASFIVLQGGIGGATISGTVLIQNGVPLGDITLNDGANVYAVNTFIISGIFKLNGNSTLKTLSTINPFRGYVDGTVDGSGTPTWITDDASNELYFGTVNKILLTSTPLTTNYGLYAQTDNSTPITGTNLELSLIGSGVGTLSVPANTFKVGDTFVAKLYGHITCVGTATVQIRVKSGSVLLADTGIIALDVTTNKHWSIEVNFTIRSLGTASVGSIVSAGLFNYIKNSGLNFEGANFVSLNNTTFDTTILNTLDITAQWNTINIGNNIYTDLFVLNKVN